MSGCGACLRHMTDDCPYYVNSEAVDKAAGCEDYLDERLFRLQHMGVDKELFEQARREE